jgi:hypothetical protein
MHLFKALTSLDCSTSSKAPIHGRDEIEQAAQVMCGAMFVLRRATPGIVCITASHRLLQHGQQRIEQVFLALNCASGTGRLNQPGSVLLGRPPPDGTCLRPRDRGQGRCADAGTV